MPPAADLLYAVLAAPNGPHPAADTLRQYAAGTLTPAQQQQIEAHALNCLRCTDVLASLAQTDATDQALAALRRRLHARVAEGAAPVPALGSWHWPRLVTAAAVVASLAGGLWGWQHRTAPAGEVATVAAPPTTLPPLAKAPVGTPAPPPTAATLPAAIAAVSARRRPTATLAYEPRREATKQLALPGVEQEEIVAMRAAAADTAIGAPAPTATAAVTAPVMSADSLTGTLSEVAVSQAQQPALANRALVNRVAGVAVIPTETAAVARRLAFAAPANSSMVGAMPAALALAPTPVGGLAPLRERLCRRAAEFVPEETHLSGSVRLRFMVGKDGKVSNLRVVRGLRPDYDAEALRLVCEGPDWVPGTAAGRRTTLPVELDVAF